MKSLPYFKWYPADWDSDEWFRGLTDSEVGFYLRCLNHAWRNGGIPADHKERCRALRIHPKTDQAAFKKVSRQFHVDVNMPSRCVCGWLEEQRKMVLAKSVKAAESVNHRYERRANVPTTADTNVPLRALALDTEPDTENHDAPDGAYSLSPPPVNGNGNGHPKKPSRARVRSMEQIEKALGERLVWWGEFWKVFPCHEGKNEAMDAFERKILTHDLAVEVYRGAKAYAAKCAADPECTMKYGQGWINRERWKDEIVVRDVVPKKNKQQQMADLYDRS